MKFRKKPVVIEAVKYEPNNGGSWPNTLEWEEAHEWKQSNILNEIYIPTLEGTMTANEGDWIIRGIKGEFYPCKPDIFEATYERVDD